MLDIQNCKSVVENYLEAHKIIREIQVHPTVVHSESAFMSKVKLMEGSFTLKPWGNYIIMGS